MVFDFLFRLPLAVLSKISLSLENGWCRDRTKYILSKGINPVSRKPKRVRKKKA